MKLTQGVLPFAAAAVLFALMVPMFVFAQGEFDALGNLLNQVIGFINGTLVPLIFAIAFLVFIYGVFQFFIAGAADEGKRDNGKSLMLYGLIGFVVMVSVWGIVNLLSAGLGLSGKTIEKIPDAPTRGGTAAPAP